MYVYVYVRICIHIIYVYIYVLKDGYPLCRIMIQNYRSLLQNIVSFLGLFCKRDLRPEGHVSSLLNHSFIQLHVSSAEYRLFVKIIGLFCKRALGKRRYSAEGTCNWMKESFSYMSLLSFAEYRLFPRALLQKRPMILGSLLMVATPYL